MYAVLDATGALLGRVTFPDRFSPMYFTGDKVAGVWKDAEDVEHARIYSLSEALSREHRAPEHRAKLYPTQWGASGCNHVCAPGPSKRAIGRLAVLCSVPFALCSAVQAQNPRVAQALELAKVWLDAQRAYQQMPGLSAAIVHDQDLVWSGGFGVTDLDKKTPATAQTIYSICSISKLFTSVAVMQLRDEGKLRLDDPVARHLPWFTALKRPKPEAGEITVEGILTHASGLPRESDHPYWSAPDFKFPTREEIIAGLSHQEALYPAETYWQYSNLGITLAGEIVSAASGKPYARLRPGEDPASARPHQHDVRKCPKPSRASGSPPATARSPGREPGTKMPFYLARGIAPAAGYASTVEDLGKLRVVAVQDAGRRVAGHPQAVDRSARCIGSTGSIRKFEPPGASVSRSGTTRASRMSDTAGPVPAIAPSWNCGPRTRSGGGGRRTR